ncbi:hypothetical protein [Cystobacter ferrugineus]|uniref:Uncharacterized protein n=1 Tax=Cystobacter ferrugineus TaxID=83449 RepID=A0A1L9AXS3_9BACT|nr:hypothetical protein [Cystobacter ferrugineus]OJH34723.1 hypothetical protein BON30_41955 [Cystobacter ferrugineus]
MGFLKFLVWTACAVGLGVFLATVDFNGRTPVEYVQREWKRQVQPNRVERVANSLRDALDDAENAVKRTTRQATPSAAKAPAPAPAPSAGPRERITHEDRAAIDRIIAQKK